MKKEKEKGKGKKKMKKEMLPDGGRSPCTPVQTNETQERPRGSLSQARPWKRMMFFLVLV
jgi:hypothetical protein